MDNLILLQISLVVSVYSQALAALLMGVTTVKVIVDKQKRKKQQEQQ